MVKIEFDTYYAQAPRKPRWLQSLNEKIAALKPKKLPIQEPQMMDVYKKIYGYRRALKFKVSQYKLFVLSYLMSCLYYQKYLKVLFGCV